MLAISPCLAHSSLVFPIMRAKGRVKGAAAKERAKSGVRAGAGVAMECLEVCQGGCRRERGSGAVTTAAVILGAILAMAAVLVVWQSRRDKQTMSQLRSETPELPREVPRFEEGDQESP